MKKSLTLKQAWSLYIGGNWHWARVVYSSKSFKKDFKKHAKTQKAQALLRGFCAGKGFIANF